MRSYTMPPHHTPDVWMRLQGETRPLVVWGMGNGADKLLVQFEKYGIHVSDFMASDGFVRGQSFHGMRVLSYAEIQEKYDDFVLVVAFASSRPEVMEMLFQRGETHPLYLPDLPVAGETCFTAAWYDAHYEELESASHLLQDDASRNLFYAILWYKLTGDIRILRDAHTGREEHTRLHLATVGTYVDCGAYNGDTLKEVLEAGAPLTHAICIEPDPHTYKRLLKYTDTLPHGLVTTVQAGVWDDTAVGCFHRSGNRNSSLVGASYQHREETVRLVTVDTLCEGYCPDYIKYDVEGVEREALLGTCETIARCHPRLLVSLYHRTEDLYALPLLVKDLYPHSALYLYRRPCLPAWEIGLVVLPENKS